MQISEANLSLLYKNFRVLFNDAFQGTEVKSDPLVMKVPSGTDTEVYDWLGAMPGMRKIVGEVTFRNVAASTWSVQNDEYAAALGIKQSRIENDTYGIYSPLMASLGRTAKQYQDVLLFGLLANGFATTDYTGSYFFANNKKREPKDAGYSNLGTYPLNWYGYASARANLLGRRNAEGLPMGLGIDLMLVCGVNNEANANQILKSATSIQAIGGTAAGTSVGGAITNVMQGTAKTLATPFIDNSAYPNAWFLLELGLPIKPLIWQVNKEIGLYSLTSMTSDHVFKFHEFLYQAYGRFAASLLMGDLAFGSTGAGEALTQFP
jgi:phage major head subunit gpT-like protein